MRVRVTIPTADMARLKTRILESAEKVESEDESDEDWMAVSLRLHVSLYSNKFIFKILLIDPGQFRIINEILQKEAKAKGRIETLTFAATAGA